MNRARIKTAAYWITTICGPASFVIGGYLHLMHSEQPMTQMTHLGYPVYFANIIGFWKIVGAVICVIPGVPLLKEWAYAGFFFLLTGAIASHVFVGDPLVAMDPAQIATPLAFLILVMASWALRPPNRRLPCI